MHIYDASDTVLISDRARSQRARACVLERVGGPRGRLGVEGLSRRRARRIFLRGFLRRGFRKSQRRPNAPRSPATSVGTSERSARSVETAALSSSSKRTIGSLSSSSDGDAGEAVSSHAQGLQSATHLYGWKTCCFLLAERLPLLCRALSDSGPGPNRPPKRPRRPALRCSA